MRQSTHMMYHTLTSDWTDCSGKHTAITWTAARGENEFAGG